MRILLVVGLGVGLLGLAACHEMGLGDGQWAVASMLGLGGEPSPFDTCGEVLAASDPRQAADCFYTTAKKHNQRGEAARRLGAYLHITKEPWLALAQAKVLWWIDGRWEEIEALCSNAAERFAVSGDAVGQVEALRLQAKWLRSSEKLEESGAVIAEMTQVAEASGDRTLVVRAGIESAKHLCSSGDLSRAAATLDHIELDADELGWRRAWLSARYFISYELGRFQEALEFINELLAIIEEAGESSPSMLLNAIKVTLAAELSDAALEEEVRSVLSLAIANGDGVNEAEARHILGRLLRNAEGREHLKRCIDSEAALGSSAIQIRCRGALAAELASDDPATARRLLTAARDALLTRNELFQSIYLGNELKEAMWRLLPREEVIETTAGILASIDALRAQQGSGADRAQLMSVWSELHYWLSGRLLEMYLEVPEPDILRQAFGLVEQRLRSRQLREELEQTHADTTPRSVLPSLDEISASMSADEALLIFQTSRDENLYGEFAGGSWLWVITLGDTKIYRLPDLATLRVSLETVLDLEDPSQDRDALALLYNLLLRKALAALSPQVEKLVMVPDSLLHRLPFVLLREAAAAEPLVTRYTISLAPSADLWHDWRRNVSTSHGGPALVFADPRLPGASSWVSDLENKFLAFLERVRRRGMELRPLPYARREAAAVGRHLDGSRLLIGKEATEQALKRHDLRTYGVLHFAAHAVAGEAGHEDAAVVLAVQGDDDGWLTPAEIARLDLRGKLVVLSTCNSHGGRFLRGEGVMSLARAFFQAGAPTVVATLGLLPDKGAAELFNRFYGHLTSGISVAKALALAQREASATGLPADAWARPVVLGHGGYVPFPVPSTR